MVKLSVGQRLCHIKIKYVTFDESNKVRNTWVRLCLQFNLNCLMVMGLKLKGTLPPALVLSVGSPPQVCQTSSVIRTSCLVVLLRQSSFSFKDLSQLSGMTHCCFPHSCCNRGQQRELNALCI